jgi:superfamily II DNA or RNA helicase
MGLRPYQVECVSKIEDSFNEFDKVLVTLFTGAGKTVIFSEIANKYINSGKKVLVLAHREELLDQAADKMMKFHGVDFTIIKSGREYDESKMFQIGSVQSLCKEDRLKKFDKDYYGLIIVDEAHHCMADTYQVIFKYFKGAKILGVTATPNRSDGKKLAKFFETTAYEYKMEDGVKDGWLSSVIMRTGNVSIDLSKVRTVAGDFIINELDNAVTKEFNKISKYIKSKLEYRKRILIFTPRIASAEVLAEVLKRDGLNAEFVSGASKNRKEITEKFKNGDIRIICNSMLYTEGFDCPEVDCIINLRPTQSKGLFTQMLGRGTRICEGKENVLYVDFLWKTDKEIMTPCNLFAETDSIAKSMRDFLVMNANKSYEMITLAQYIDLVMGGIKIMEGARMEWVVNIDKKMLKTVRMFAYLINDRKLLEYEPTYFWEQMPPTSKQVEFLEGKCSISCEWITKGLASKIIDVIVKRVKDKKCTVKQMFFLAKNGIFDKASEISMEDAGKIMDDISKNYWKVPYHISKTYGGTKRLTESLVKLKDIKIESIEEGQRECAKMF